MYVNDVTELNNDSSIVTHADDTSLFVTGHDINEVFTKSQKALSDLWEWSNTNLLKINAGKTKDILFRAKNKHARLPADLCLGGSVIRLWKSINRLASSFLLI